jgi:glycosyltransferase involved in cell wall biosynthesis
MASDGSEAAGGFVADFAKVMSRHMPVRVVGPGHVEGIDEKDDSVSVRRFASDGKPLSLLSPIKPWHWLTIVRTLYSLRAQTLAADSDGRIQHVLALWVLPSGWAARTLARASNIPYSVWALGSDIWTLGKLPVFKGIIRDVAREAKYSYADGLKLAADAAKITGRKFDFLPSCRLLDVHRNLPVATKPPYRLFFLGRWHHNKGVDLLFDALDLLDETDWACIHEIHIAGGGPLQKLVHRRVNQLQGLGRPIRLSGFLNRKQVIASLAETDRLLLPSRIESIPVVFSDSLAFGVPVVSMPVGDLPSLISNGIGWLAANVSSEAFVGAIRASLADNDCGMYLDDTVRKFDLKKITASFYAQLCQEGKCNG